jgi:hypothetical protein
MRTLTDLKSEAQKAAAWRGHHLAAWYTDVSRGLATSHCATTGCQAWVRVENRPSPNGIEIGGSAVAVNCPTAD